MSFYLNTLKIRLKLSINKFFIATILMYILFIIVILLGYHDPMASMSNIGFVYESNDFTDDLINQYNYYAKDFFMAQKYDSEEELKQAVQINDIDCGYVLPNDYKKGEKIEYVYSDKTISGIYNNLLLSSIYLQNKAGDLGYSELKKVTSFDKNEIKSEIDKINSEYLEYAPFMEYNYTGLNGDNIILNNGIYSILCGVLGLFLTLFGLIFYLDTIFEKQFNIYLRLKTYKTKLLYYLGNLSAYFIVLCLFGIVSISLIDYTFLKTFISLNQLITIVLFSFAIASLVYTLSYIKNSTVGSFLILVYFTSALIFGSVFFTFNSFIKYIYPTFYYKQAIGGCGLFIFLIFIFALFVNGINYILIRSKDGF